MKFNHILLPVILIACFGLLNCTNKQNNLKKFNTGKALIYSLDSLFINLSNVPTKAKGSSEAVVHINEEIRKTIESIDAPQLLEELAVEFKSKKHDFTFIVSKDKKVGVFSWDTRMGSSEQSIKNIALYKSGDRVLPTSLYGKPMVYDKVYQIEPVSGNTIYTFHGHSEAMGHPNFRLHAYTLKSGHLEETPVFPLNTTFISSEKSFADSDIQSMDFEVSKNGSHILISKALDSATVIKTLAFDGEKFASAEEKLEISYK
ncbi:hypothetical protein EZV76_12580 [Flagellimonas alvinocaridis]|uniref:Lipoprotein n=1 Tax=Flagellimonas alvinocaridis TaxID=2530200 RepID=A0A4S8RT26_9FLAO|nr:hypothetical protein [Allomuricauda alvinocaridis]THV58299.1 hypothetical protein EZV76_12580 [Allomuricauda alvinocaridis]